MMTFSVYRRTIFLKKTKHEISINKAVSNFQDGRESAQSWLVCQIKLLRVFYPPLTATFEILCNVWSCFKHLDVESYCRQILKATNTLTN